MQKIIQSVKMFVLVAVLLFVTASPAFAKDVYYLVHEPSGLCAKGFYTGGAKFTSCLQPEGQQPISINPGAGGYHITSEGTITGNSPSFADACWYPEGGEAPSNDARIAITKDKCNLPGARFRLREDNSLEHVSSGKCIHPLGGSAYPDPNTPLVLYDGCGEDRLAFRVDYVDALVRKEYSADERVVLVNKVIDACDEIGATCAKKGNSKVSYENGDWEKFQKSCGEIGGVRYADFVFTSEGAKNLLGCDLSKNYYIVYDSYQGSIYYVYDKNRGIWVIPVL